MTTPLNWNLTTTDLNGPVLVLGDSQAATHSTTRFAAQLPLVSNDYGYTLVGHHIPMRAQASVGALVANVSGSGIAHTDVSLGDDWTAQSADDDYNWSLGKQVAFSSEQGNFVDFMQAQARGSDLANLDMSGPMRFTLALHNHSNSVTRISLEEYRGTSEGNNGNFGNGGSGTTVGGDLSWSEDGTVKVIHKGIRGSASMPGGSSLVGCILETSGAVELNKEFRLFGAIVRQTGGTSASPDVDSPVDGTMFCYMGDSGWAADDFNSAVDDESYKGMIRAADGFKTVLIPLGHNDVSSGTYSSQMQALGEKIVTLQTGLGYDAPKIILEAMWSVPDRAARMATQADDLFALARSKSWGFVNFHKAYNSLDPGANGKRLDGTTATYTMDVADLHPNDTSTAQFIAKDNLEMFLEANIVTSLGGKRSRNRDRLR